MFKTIIKTFLSLIALFFVTGAYSDLRFPGTVTPYGHAVKSGVFGESINIEYDRHIYDNKRSYSPLMYILDQFRETQAQTSITKGWDRVIEKDIIYSAAGFTSQGTAGDALTLTLNANDKDNLIVNQVLKLDFEPTDPTTHTNEVYVTNKNVGDTTTIAVKAVNPALKIGTAGSDTVAAETLIHILGTMFGQGDESVEPISFHPTPFHNFVQEFRTPYDLSWIAAKENLYQKGTKHNQLNMDAKGRHLSENEKAFLFQGEAYSKNIELSTDTVQIGKMRGLIHWIKNGGGPAVKSYTAGNFTHDHFDDFQWNLFDPELEDGAGKRLLICNAAMQKYFTDLKKDKPGVELAPNDTYGIPGISTIRTERGSFDLFVSQKINNRYRGKNDPFGIALTPTMVQIKPMIKQLLRKGIQNPSATKQKDEWYGAWTYLLNNAGTGYHGIIYPI